MTTIPLYGGPSKRDIINRAYGLLGMSFTEVDISPEDYEAGLMCLNDAMAELADQQGVNLGFNFPTNGTNGSPEDESGIPRAAVRGASLQMAKCLAPSIGKTMPPEALSELARCMGALRSTYQAIPMMEMGRHTIRGAGNRRWFGRPFFVTDISADEVAQ